MATTLFTPEQLRAMFTGQSMPLTYKDAVRCYWKLKVHADGEIPLQLIQEARPNESPEVAKYRKSIYEAETQNPIERVIGVFEKIRRSPDFMIRFSDELPASVVEEESPEKYLTEYYPVYNTIEEWLFQEALRHSAIDANALIVVIPDDLVEAGEAIANNEYIKPIAKIFNTTCVIKYEPENYAVVKSYEFSDLLSPARQQERIITEYNDYVRDIYTQSDIPSFRQGQVYYIIDTMTYQKWEENEEGKYQLTQMLLHGLDELPVFQMPGKYFKRYGKNVVKKPLLYPMVPHLNKAARESNDLDAGVIMHLFLEKWRINNVECPTCKGTTQIIGENGPIPCPRCIDNPGYATGKSPFNEVIINPLKIFSQDKQLPIPPLGYVEKNPEILKLQNERIQEHIYKALAAVNMEHLAEAQLNQSGVAKQYDRDEVNTLIYSFAENLIYILNYTIYLINELRYKGIVPNEEDRKTLLPVVPVPEKFDVINTTFLLTELQSAKTAGVNGIIIAEMQKELSQKKFYANTEVADFVEIVMDLDPFPDKTIEEKALMMSNKMATEQDVILSNYISDFVKQAMDENEKFADMDLKEKRVILDKMAKAKLDEMSAANQVMQDILGGNGQQQLGSNQSATDQQPGSNQSATGGKQQPLPLKGNGVITNPNANFGQ